MMLAAFSVGAQPPVSRAAVDAKVWQALESTGRADVLLILEEQADLKGAVALPSKEAKGRYVFETLRAVAEASQGDLKALLSRQGLAHRSFYIVNALAVQVDGEQIEALARRGDVARIVANAPFRAVPDLPEIAGVAPEGIELNLTRVHADDVWALGHTAEGVVVAGQDTGYDWDHPALIRQYRGWEDAAANHDYNWHDAIHSSDGPCGADSPEPCDDHGHGTHTMGILVGDDGADHQIGMAPGARWIGCRNMDQGVGSPASYMECFEFFLAPYPLDGAPDQGNPGLAPDVVNNSWACLVSEGCIDPGILELSVEALRQAGIVVVASAGNTGSACGTIVSPPAIYPGSLTVGNFSHWADQIATNSSRGPVTYDGRTYRKPDLAAPGTGILSSLPGGNYGYMSGTSMAAPHVAGAVALLLSAAPTYRGQVEAIEQLLMRTAEPKTTIQGCGGDGPTDVPNNAWGWGILDVQAAVQWAFTSGTCQGTVRSARSGAPIPWAQVWAQDSLASPVAETETDRMGNFALPLPVGSYQVMTQATGYVSETVSAVAITAGEITEQEFLLARPFDVYLPMILRAG
jgi:subtilisin family serine protease